MSSQSRKPETFKDPIKAFFMRLSADKRVRKGDLRSQQEVEYGAQLTALTDRWQTPDLIVTEKRSGALPLRKLLELVRTLPRGSTIHLVRIDRATRQGVFRLGYIISEARDHGIRIESIDDGVITEAKGEEEMFAGFKAYAAQIERERVSQRVKDMIKDRRSKGLLWGVELAKANGNFRPGHPPLNETFQKAVPRILELRQNGLSIREITAKVSAEFGEEFSKSNVHLILKKRGVK